MNKLQMKLREKHGTPAEFSAACWRAVVEISVDECVAAIERYLREWFKAGSDSGSHFILPNAGENAGGK